MTTFGALVSGYLVACYAVIGLFFLRFWRQAHDRLFGYFAWGFILLAAQRALLALTATDDDAAIALYALRAFAFLLIIYAIIEKNRKAS